MAVAIEILKRCVQNDQRAIKQLYEYCFGKFMPIGMRYHINQEDARSSLNLAFVKIIKDLPSRDLKTLTFDSWANRILTNTLVDEYRKRKLQKEHYLQKETEREIDSISEYAINQGLENLNYNTLLELIQQVPENSRIVFNLFVLEGYSHQEIAEMLDMPLGTSKWHIANARKILRELIEKVTQNTELHEFVG